MTFGQKLALCRKEQKLSQAETGKRSGINGDIVGKYERDEMKPSIDAAAKMADYLEVSLDYLVGKTDIEVDPKTLSRIVEVSTFNEEDREHIFSVIDAFIAKRKIQSITG